MDGSRVILSAHRGDRLKYPENTLPAFSAALDFGVDMIETDIRMTKDNELVIIHDRSALRTTGVDKNIDEMTLDEVKKINAGFSFNPDVHAEIPTVKEFLDLIKGSNILVNWEIKVYPKDFGEEITYEVTDKLIKLIEEYDMTKYSMINSFSKKTLEYIKKKYGNKFPLHGQGIHNCPKSNDESETKDYELFDWCCLWAEKPKTKPIDYKENFDYCIKNNVIPCVCIPDTLEDYKKAIDYGCKMFTSNDIYSADEILKKLGVR